MLFFRRIMGFEVSHISSLFRVGTKFIDELVERFMPSLVVARSGVNGKIIDVANERSGGHVEIFVE
jgi:hypothetical protein